MDEFTTCRDRIKSLLWADPFFSGSVDNKPVPVITEEVGDIAAELQRKLQALGVGVVLMLPTIRFPDNERNPIILIANFPVSITENPLLNRAAAGTGKTTLAIVRNIMRIVHGKHNGVAPGHSSNSRLLIDQDAGHQEPLPPALKAILLYVLSINTHLNIT